MSLEDLKARLGKEQEHLESVATELSTLIGKEESDAEGSHSLTKLQYFNVFRKYRMFEQNLLNHRLTWGLAIQGFLFYAYGYSAQIKPDAVRSVTQLKILLRIISIGGLLFSLSVLCGVVGAWIVLENLEKEWNSKVQSKVIPCNPYLPNPAGGGKRKAVLLGYIPPFFIPTGFAFAWLYLVVNEFFPV